MCRSQRTTYKSVLPFYHVGSRDEPRVVRLGSKLLYLLNHLTSTTLSSVNSEEGDIYQPPSLIIKGRFSKRREGLEVAACPLPRKSKVLRNMPHMPPTSVNYTLLLKSHIITYTDSTFLIGVLQPFHLPKE